VASPGRRDRQSSMAGLSAVAKSLAVASPIATDGETAQRRLRQDVPSLEEQHLRWPQLVPKESECRSQRPEPGHLPLPRQQLVLHQRQQLGRLRSCSCYRCHTAADARCTAARRCPQRPMLNGRGPHHAPCAALPALFSRTDVHIPYCGPRCTVPPAPEPRTLGLCDPGYLASRSSCPETPTSVPQAPPPVFGHCRILTPGPAQAAWQRHPGRAPAAACHPDGSR